MQLYTKEQQGFFPATEAKEDGFASLSKAGS